VDKRATTPAAKDLGHGPNIVEHGGEGLEDVEGADDQNGQEQGLITKLCVFYQLLFNRLLIDILLFQTLLIYS
jgi:hypothetical protein